MKNRAEAVKPNQANTSSRGTGTLLPDEGKAAAAAMLLLRREEERTDTERNSR